MSIGYDLSFGRNNIKIFKYVATKNYLSSFGFIIKLRELVKFNLNNNFQF